MKIQINHDFLTNFFIPSQEKRERERANQGESNFDEQIDTNQLFACLFTFYFIIFFEYFAIFQVNQCLPSNQIAKRWFVGSSRR